MPIIEHLPIELSNVFNSPEFDSDAGVIIESVEFINGGVILNFSINFFGEVPRQLWRVTIDGVKSERISRTWSGHPVLYSEHVLLLEYQDVASELYFKGITANWRDLFLDIFEKVTQLCDDKDHTLQYIFSPERIKEISGYGHGLFARGPKTVLKIYERCLNEYNIQTYYIGEYEPQEEAAKLMLFELGNSFIIGKTFLFERQRDI